MYALFVEYVTIYGDQVTHYLPIFDSFSDCMVFRDWFLDVLARGRNWINGVDSVIAECAPSV